MSASHDLSLRRGYVTAHVRMDAVNSETLTQYFTLLRDVLTEHDFFRRRLLRYTILMKVAFLLTQGPPMLSAKKGTKKVRYRSSGKKGQVTIVGCASAAGQAIPPMVIFDAKRLNPEWTNGEFPGTTYGLSDNGWINTEPFEAWMSEHFLQHAVLARPLLLLLDGHSTHYQPQLLRLAMENDVIILCLPPHTTHEAQPLGLWCFWPPQSSLVACVPCLSTTKSRPHHHSLSVQFAVFTGLECCSVTCQHNSRVSHVRSIPIQS